MKQENEPKVGTTYLALSQEDVDNYVSLSTKIKSLEDEKAALREYILAAFQDGDVCPDTGPFILALCQQDSPVYSWKQICEAVVVELTPKAKEAAKAVIAGMSAAKKPKSLILVKPNQKWLDQQGSAPPSPPVVAG